MRMIERAFCCLPGSCPQRPRPGGLGMFSADGLETIEPVSFVLTIIHQLPFYWLSLAGNFVSDIDLSIGRQQMILFFI